ncbi:Transglutaminase-like superfamily protein [Cryobacterium psychrotolerans]|uniref:Transglutaminase-like superfamily protein n=1 Tax=Cryobacterium psychrotolerans TaxID=386301 RepID=A0A1G8YUU5_9MICO|nr:MULTISPECIES: transglutaminase-like domain-containing protein [Cryobacterium]TFD43282.1 transglutaminase domain-containing protein [Cryobacterium sp. TMT1-2-1]TFD85659.1 transglutaminase domain-containing protein [Cryobacterium psychrotolerans]SDK06204.1 Transglutaminase-like superfamily protein [Cryobacterium psychrotolerans]
MNAERPRAAGTRPGWGFIAGNTLALMAATAMASLTLWPVYQSIEFIVLVAATFALGAAIAIAGARLCWPAWLVALVTVAVYLLAGVPLAIPGRAIERILPSVDGLLELLAATALSWKQLVTIVLPVGAYQALLVPAFILVLLSTVIGLSAALRSRIAELALLAPIALFIAGIGLGPTAESSPIEGGLGLFVVLLFWLLWVHWQRRRTAVRLIAQQSRRTLESTGDRALAAARGLVSAAVIIALAIAVGTVAAIAVPVSEPRDVLRARVQQPFDPRDYPSPLSGFRGYLQPEQSERALLTVAGLPAGGRLRVATLDSYDGIVYSVGSDTVRSASGSFTRLPYRIDQGQVDGEPLTLRVTVDGYRGVWVPGAGALERIEFLGSSATARADSFYYNDNSTTAAVLGGLQEGDSYRSRSVLPRPAAELAGARPGTEVLSPISVIPDGITQALDGYVRAGDPPGVQLQSMLEGLRTTGYISHGVNADEPASRSGHGADRITQLFGDQPMLGDQEQYAVAAALMARKLGFPSRVVVGFVPASAGGGESVTVTGADISAWIEVQTAADGWISIDPNPAVREVPPKQPDEPTVVSRPQTVVPPPAPDAAAPGDLSPPESTVEDPPAPMHPLLAFLLAALTALGWTLLGLLILLAPFLAIIAAKHRRRRLRRAADSPADRISGGWRDFADTATDFRVPVPPSATRTELAEAVGGQRSLVLASVVDRALFSPDEPAHTDADAVWGSVGELRAAFRGTSSRRERVKALISVRSFGRYSGGASKRTVEGAGS